MLDYQRVENSGELPNIGHLKPFKAVVIIELQVSEERQREISTWLVGSGCLYMLAWGEGCSSWDDSVDVANLERFDFGDIPDEEFVMTTWHETESLKDVFSFAHYWALAYDRNIELGNVLLLHLGNTDRSEEFKKLFEERE